MGLTKSRPKVKAATMQVFSLAAKAPPGACSTRRRAPSAVRCLAVFEMFVQLFLVAGVLDPQAGDFSGGFGVRQVHY